MVGCSICGSIKNCQGQSQRPAIWKTIAATGMARVTFVLIWEFVGRTQVVTRISYLIYNNRQ
jgi:hypothetical protein